MNKWLTIKKLSELTSWPLRTVKHWCKINKFGEFQKRIRANGGQQYRISIESPLIPPECKHEVAKDRIPVPGQRDPSVDSNIISSAPVFAREKFKKYITLIEMTEGKQGREIRNIVDAWNANNPDNTTSYASLMRARRKYTQEGPQALLAQYGKSAGKTSVQDDLFENFKSLYLKEGAPGLYSCWKITLGYASQKDNFDYSRFPSPKAFQRRLQREITGEAVYFARKGARATNKKYGHYIKRNYDNILAGEVWVSDHAQIDVAASYIYNGKEKYCFPWVTAWRDFKSGKWLGWDVHPEPPNSDHIFISFFRAADTHGIPVDIIIDNGKDYRSRDLSGGHRFVKVKVDEINTRALTAALGIKTTFALPYNAQTKPIERDFLKIKEWLSKHSVGYRGGNVVERPESLQQNIKSGRIETIQDIADIFNTCINDILNCSEITSGHRAGTTPDHIWAAEIPAAAEKGALKRVTTDALKLFCSRTSGDKKIGRRGFYDSDLGIDYFDEWMVAHKRRLVYLRRDPQRYQEAWVFDSKTNDYLGKAYILPAAPALARTDVERAQLAEDIRLKRRTNKILKSFAKVDNEIPLAEKMEFLAAGTKVLNKMRGHEPVVVDIDTPKNYLITDMNRAISAEERHQAEGTADLDDFIPQKKKVKKHKLDYWESMDKAMGF